MDLSKLTSDELQEIILDLESKVDLYKKIADNSFDWELMLDDKGCLLYISPSCSLITGYSSDEFIENPVLINEIIYIDDKYFVNNQIKNPIRDKGNSGTFDFRIITKNGNLKWINSVCRAVFDSNGKFIGQRISNRDITNQRFLQDQLNLKGKKLDESELLVEKIIDNLPIGLQIFDDKGYSKRLNFKQKDLLGIPDLETGIGKFNVLTDPFSISSGAAELYKSVYSEKKTIQREYKYNFDIPDNKWNTSRGVKVFQETIFPITNQDGLVTNVVALLNDISERITTEGQILGLNEELNAIFDNFPHILILVDGNRNILKTNKAYSEAKNLHPEDYLGKTGFGILNCLFATDGCESAPFCSNCLLDKILQQSFKDKSNVFKMEAILPVMESGKITEQTLLVSNIYLNPVNNDKPKVLFVIDDITAQKQTEQEIKKLSTAIQQSPAAIVITDILGNIEYVNPQFTAVTGYLPEEAIGQNPKILNSGKTPKEVFKNLWETILSGNIWRGEFINRNKNGQEIWELGIIAPIKDSKGKITNFMAIKEDITKQKNIELQLRELNATKDKFFSIIAHDLKNPFNSIIGFSEMIVNQEISDYDHVLKIANMIHNTARQSFNLLVNLLDWSYSQTNRIQFKPEWIDFDNCIDEIFNLLSNPAEIKGVSLKRAIQPGLRIYADKNMLNAILRNLVSNALKYSRENGYVMISALDVKKEIIISVTDTGIGISDEDQKKLFRSDIHFTTYGTANEKGTGLGLILCKDFVERHKGTISVKSTIGKGTTFIIRLPCVDTI